MNNKDKAKLYKDLENIGEDVEENEDITEGLIIYEGAPEDGTIVKKFDFS